MTRKVWHTPTHTSGQLFVYQIKYTWADNHSKHLFSEYEDLQHYKALAQSIKYTSNKIWK